MQIDQGSSHGFSTDYIVISHDGLVWTPIRKDYISQIKPIYIANYSNYANGYPYADRIAITIEGPENGPYTFDIQDVTNQPTWTASVAGLNQAVQDISSW